MFLLDNMMNNCSDPALAAIISVIRKVVDIVWIIGPILAIVGAIVALTKLLANPDEKKYKSLFKNMIIALVILFMLPAMVNTVMKLFDDQYEISACWNAADTIFKTSGKKSNYIDENKKPHSNIYTDPDDYTVNESGSTAGYVSSTNHVSSINKIKYNLYNQNDPKWASVKYPGSNDTIGDIGCMITSVAVVASAYNPSINPKVVFDSGHRNSYPRNSVNSLSSNSFSCSYGSADSASIKQALLSGKVVIIMVYGGSKGGSSPFTNSQHYMALIDISGSNIFVGNAYSTSGRGFNGWFNSSDVLRSVQTADYCTPTSSLLDKYK